MANITWQFQATVQGGPAITLSQPTITAAAYDITQVTVTAATNNVSVPIQPSTTAGDVIFLVVSSSQYDPGINYSVDALGVAHVLDGPHILVGTGAVSFLNNPPQKLIFNNSLTKDINVQVIVGRKVP